jgi:hypothetical protein
MSAYNYFCEYWRSKGAAIDVSGYRLSARSRIFSAGHPDVFSIHTRNQKILNSIEMSVWTGGPYRHFYRVSGEGKMGLVTWDV